MRSVTVTGERQGGEIEALTIERTADNIVQVLPADVINSLPNTNITSDTVLRAAYGAGIGTTKLPGYRAVPDV